jgi:hypothetical protein
MKTLSQNQIQSVTGGNSVGVIENPFGDGVILIPVACFVLP